MAGLDRVIDAIVRKAMEDGAFDNLPGAGKPLDLRENPFVEPDWRLAYRMLAKEGFSLPWMEKRNQIEQEYAAARQALVRTWEWWQAQLAEGGETTLAEQEWRTAQEHFRQKAVRLNKSIADYNLEVPADVFFRRLIDADAEIAGLQQPEE